MAHFNAGRFFEAHEAFEALLDTVEDDDRWPLVLGLVQVAVGYHKWSSGHPGAATMLARGLEKLAPFPPLAWGVAVERLRRRIRADLARLARDPAREWRPHASPRLLWQPTACNS